MPNLTTRSRSARLDNESADQFFTDKKGFQIVSTAAVQLMLSTSDDTERWFKSSTGILCLVRDTPDVTNATTTESSVYYLRLYSFMQGNMWEQRLIFPFEYVKQSDFFHYIKLEKFSFGFKFVCDDEAERFYTIVRKFCQLHSSAVKLDEEKQQRASRRSSFSFRTRQASLTSQPHESPSVVLSSGGGGGLRKRSVSKKDISCPFRCSCIDLTTTQTGVMMSTSSLSSPPIKTTNKKRTYSTNNVLAPDHSITATTAFSASLVPSSPINTSSPATTTTMTPMRDRNSKNNSSTSRKPPTPVSTAAAATRKDNNNNEWSLPDLIRHTLKELKFPTSQNYVEIVSDYISQFDSIHRFEKAIEMESEKSKLTAFLYVSDALRNIDKSKQLQQQAKGETTPVSDKSKLAKSLLESTPLTASFPIAHPESSSIHMSTVDDYHDNDGQQEQPVYTTVNVVKTRIHQFNLQQQQQHGTPSIQRVPSSPAASSNKQTTTTISYSTRTQTPSPSRSSIVYKRINAYNNSNNSGDGGDNTIHNKEVSAPPKPPRRSSLRFLN